MSNETEVDLGSLFGDSELEFTSVKDDLNSDREDSLPLPDFPLDEQLNDYLFDNFYDDHDSESYHPSQSYYLCPRKEILRKDLGDRPEIEASSTLKAIFEVGHSLHELIQEKWLGPMGVLKGEWGCPDCTWVSDIRTLPEECPECGYEGLFDFYEVPVKGEIGGGKISGRADGILTFPDHDISDRPFDIKTTSKLNTVKKEGADLKYIYQLQVYSAILGYDEMTLMFFGKRYHNRYYQHFRLNEDFINDFSDKIEKAETVKKVDMPEVKELLVEEEGERICDSPDHPRAGDCPYSKECFQDYPPEYDG